MRRLTVRECKKLLDGASPDSLASLIALHAPDPRAGVRHAVNRARKRLDRHSALLSRWAELIAEENRLAETGAVAVGLDEVGRGALAGPVSVAAVVLRADRPLLGLDDSKRLTPAMRSEMASSIRSSCVCVAVVHTEAPVIDRLGMSEALRRGMAQAIGGLTVRPTMALVDGHPVGLSHIEERSFVGGDSRIACIAAASVVAKVERDALMCELDSRYPGYGFEINKGYGTPDHLAAISRLGTCSLHRRSFSGCEDAPRLF